MAESPGDESGHQRGVVVLPNPAIPGELHDHELPALPGGAPHEPAADQLPVLPGATNEVLEGEWADGPQQGHVEVHGRTDDHEYWDGDVIYAPGPSRPASAADVRSHRAGQRGRHRAPNVLKRVLGIGPKPETVPKVPKPRDSRAEAMKAAKQVAKASMKAEKGRRNPNAIQRLDSAQERLRDVIDTAVDYDSQEELSAADKLQLAFFSDELVEQLRVEKYSQRRLGLISGGLELLTGKFISSRISEFFKSHKKTAIAAALLVAAGVATTIATGGMSLMAVGAASAMGAITGGWRKWQNERTVTARENFRPAVDTRWGQIGANRREMYAELTGDDDTRLSSYLNQSYQQRLEAVEAYRTDAMKREHSAMLGGAAVGAVMAPLAAAGAFGIRHLGEGLLDSVQAIDWQGTGRDLLARFHSEPQFVPPQGGRIEAAMTDELPATPAQIDEAGVKAILQNDPSKITGLEGFKNIHVTVVDEEHAALTFKGKTAYGAFENGTNVRGNDIPQAFMDAWTKLHGNPNVQIDEWGDVRFENGHYEQTGNNWGAKVTVSKLTLVDGQGNLHVFDGALGKAQHANLVDLLRQDDIQVLDPNNQQQMTEFIGKYMPTGAEGQAANLQPVLNTQADIIVDDFIDQTRDIPLNDDGQVQLALKSSVTEYMDRAPQFATLTNPALMAYLATEMSRQLDAFLSWESVGRAAPIWATAEGLYATIGDAADRVRKRRRQRATTS